MNEQDVQKMIDLIKDIRFAMLTTMDHEGRLRSRPMATMDVNIRNFEGVLWFFTKVDTAKVHDIEEDKEVNLAYANPSKQHYVSITGRASIVKNTELIKRLWNPTLRSWFPRGTDDPELVLIQVIVDSAELWDSPPSKVVQLIGLARFLMTGKSLGKSDIGQHIEIRPN